MTEFEIVWQQCVMLIKEQGIISDAEYNTWFKNLIPRANESKMEIVAGNRLIHDFITKKYWQKVSSILQELNNGGTVDFIVDKVVPVKSTQEIGNEPTVNNTKIEVAPETESIAVSRSKNANKQPKVEKEVLSQLHQSTKLNKDFTFDSLIRGNSNQLAYAIGMHITQEPGNRNHNPLFVYGGVGLGKTHYLLYFTTHELSLRVFLIRMLFIF